MYNELMRSSIIPKFPLVLTFLIKPGSCRVGYSSDTPKKGSQETCESPDGSNYVCSVGHCCGGDGCCTYYYELWWFWLIWGVIILMSCCCAYHHRQKRREDRARGGHNTTSGTRHPYAGVCNYPGPPLDNQVLGYCKLPVYDEIIRIPPTASPPPPYSSRRRSINTIACLQPNEAGEMQMTIVPCHITGSMLSLASLSHYVPGIISQSNNIHISVNPTSMPPTDQLATDDNNNTITPDFPTSSEQMQSAPPLPKKEVENTSKDLTDVDRVSVVKSPQSVHEGCSYITEELPHDVESSDNSEYEDEDDYLLGVDPNNNIQPVMMHPKELIAGRQSPRIGADEADALRPYDDVCSQEASSFSSVGDIVLNLTP
uniref:Uncharacterized protein LOC100185871 n=1 Tax=Phallusia mammillata TaxID=59560 RepID=A0A6F9DJ31_9ASCI|nr:uncharacterized protein LOC100185871 [Phallusia mammillata]